MKATRVCYEGRVQGVGFRWSARRIAQGYDITGHVKNLPDGRVELLASGASSEIQSFLQEIRDSALAGHVAAEHVEEVSLPTPLRGFQIVE